MQSYSTGTVKPETPTLEKVINELKALFSEQKNENDPVYSTLLALKQFFLGKDVSNHPDFTKQERLAEDGRTKVSYVSYTQQNSYVSYTQQNDAALAIGGKATPTLERYIVLNGSVNPPIVYNFNPAEMHITIQNGSAFRQSNSGYNRAEKEVAKENGSDYSPAKNEEASKGASSFRIRGVCGDWVDTHTSQETGACNLTFSENAVYIQASKDERDKYTGKRCIVYEASYSDGELSGSINPERLKNNVDEFTITNHAGEKFNFDKEKGRMVDKDGKVFEAIKAIDDNGNEIKGRGVNASAKIEDTSKNLPKLEADVSKAKEHSLKPEEKGVVHNKVGSQNQSLGR